MVQYLPVSAEPVDRLRPIISSQTSADDTSLESTFEMSSVPDALEALRKRALLLRGVDGFTVAVPCELFADLLLPFCAASDRLRRFKVSSLCGFRALTRGLRLKHFAGKTADVDRVRLAA